MWLYRHGYYVNLVLFGASIPNTVINKKQKKLLVTFCNPTESHHCKSRVNNSVYTEVFWEPNFTWVSMHKLLNSKIWGTHF